MFKPQAVTSQSADPARGISKHNGRTDNRPSVFARRDSGADGLPISGPQPSLRPKPRPQTATAPICPPNPLPQACAIPPHGRPPGTWPQGNCQGHHPGPSPITALKEQRTPIPNPLLTSEERQDLPPSSADQPWEPRRNGRHFMVQHKTMSIHAQSVIKNSK